MVLRRFQQDFEQDRLLGRGFHVETLGRFGELAPVGADLGGCRGAGIVREEVEQEIQDLPDELDLIVREGERRWI